MNKLLTIILACMVAFGYSQAGVDWQLIGNSTLANDRNIVLEQNVPNPFAEMTVIGYSLPMDVEKAQIYFYNIEGRIIKTVDIMDRGDGQLNVFAQDLSTGVYTYTLVADDQIVETRKMIKNK